MGKIGIHTARDRVREYCQSNKIKQSEFGEMLGLSKTTFQRFMGGGGETTGKGSLAYEAIIKFFNKLKREDVKRKVESSSAWSIFNDSIDPEGGSEPNVSKFERK